MWSHVCVICVCLVFLSVGDLLENSSVLYTYKHVFNILLVLDVEVIAF